MKYKAIIFDKDGTVLNFEALWVRISELAVTEILTKLNMPLSLLADVLTAFGVEEGIARIDGILCWGTYHDMSEAMHRTLAANGCPLSREELHEVMVESYHRYIREGDILPICPNLREIFLSLREKGLRLFLVTSDDMTGALRCLEALGVRDLFEAVYAHDGITPHKPSPDLFRLVCEQNGLSPSDLVMVGDSMVDIRFAKNGGCLAVGVGHDERNRAILQAGGADLVLPDISYLEDALA